MGEDQGRRRELALLLHEGRRASALRGLPPVAQVVPVQVAHLQGAGHLLHAQAAFAELV